MKPEQNLNSRVLLRVHALLMTREIIHQKARQQGVSVGAWIHQAIDERLMREGEQSIGEYPAEGWGGKRAGAGTKLREG